jgi:hypothetical protein
MELPANVLIHNPILGLKGASGVLLEIRQEGYFEANCQFGEKVHRVLLPIDGTVLIARDQEDAGVERIEVER